MTNFRIELLRNGKTIYIVMRGDDYSLAVRTDRGNNPRMKYGSGPMWHVMDVRENL
jgi:hypothetical protein